MCCVYLHRCVRVFEHTHAHRGQRNTLAVLFSNSPLDKVTEPGAMLMGSKL